MELDGLAGPGGTEPAELDGARNVARRRLDNHAAPLRRAVNSETASPDCVVWQSRHMAAVRTDILDSAARTAMPSGRASVSTTR